MFTALRNKDEKGFTLIELMIVIAIIGILSAIAIPNFLSYRRKGADGSCESMLISFYSTALSQFADTGVPATYTISSAASSNAFPKGFTLKPSDFPTTLGGTIVIAQDGTVTSTITAMHVNSDTLISVDENGHSDLP